MALGLAAYSASTFTSNVAAQATVVSPSFSPAAGDVLYCVGFIDNNLGAVTENAPTNSGTALTWTLVKRENTFSAGAIEGSLFVWRAFNANAQSSITVTVNSPVSTAQLKGVAVIGFTGADSAQAGAVSVATEYTAANTTPAAGALTTSQAGSWIWMAGWDWTNFRSGMTPASGQSAQIAAMDASANGDTEWLQKENPQPASGRASGTAVTMSDTGSTASDLIHLVAWEIIPAPGGAPPPAAAWPQQDPAWHPFAGPSAPGGAPFGPWPPWEGPPPPGAVTVDSTGATAAGAAAATAVATQDAGTLTTAAGAAAVTAAATQIAVAAAAAAATVTDVATQAVTATAAAAGAVTADSATASPGIATQAVTLTGPDVLPGLPGGEAFAAWPLWEGAALPAGPATITATAAAAGAGAVTAVVTQAAPAAAAGAGAVSDVVTQIAIAAAAGAASVTAAGSVAGAGSTASAAGAASVTALATQIAPATAAGAGAVTGTATQIAKAAATGAAAATAAGAITGTANVAGAAAATAKAAQAVPASAAGAAVLSALAAQAATATLTAAGTVTAAAAVQAQVTYGRSTAGGAAQSAATPSGSAVTAATPGGTTTATATAGGQP
jgi:hypothetical protein